MVRSLFRRRIPSALSSVLLTVWLTAHAQPAAAAGRPDPLDPQADVPASSYVSSLAQYRRMGDPKALSWREANDTVARIGGWRAYAREAQQSAPPALPTEAAQPRPAGDTGSKQP